MRRHASFLALVTPLLIAQGSAVAQMVLKTENFNADPGWDSHNNRAQSPPPRLIVQNFGSKASSNAGGAAGEVGGMITPTGEAAYYAKAITPASFSEPLFASGKLNIQGQGHTLLGFFNANTINEWRTPNTVSLRLLGRETHFDAFADYGTAKWRAGGTQIPTTFSVGPGATHNWSLQYDPAGNNGGGRVTATIDSQSVVTNLEPGHKLDGATFNRFGLLNVIKSADGAGQVYIDDVNINGVTDSFATNPNWTGLRNQTGYSTTNVRPRFDFGYSPTTNLAGGAAPGEIGGHTFRGNSGDASLMAYYGDELDQTLTTENPLHASGKVSFRRGVSDSTTMIGFFHSSDSIRVSASQASHVPENFVGAVIEGPSAEGFYLYPTYGTDEEGVSARDRGENLPYIYPDGTSHDWSLDYDPATGGGVGRVSVTLDGQVATLDLTAAHRAIGGHFDRFGMITTHVDGNGQTVYFDDLTYTIAVPEPSAAAAAACLAAGLLLLPRSRRCTLENSHRRVA